VPGPRLQMRAPGGGSNAPLRLPTEMRQEYESYMQKRLRMMSQPRQTVVSGRLQEPGSGPPMAGPAMTGPATAGPPNPSMPDRPPPPPPNQPEPAPLHVILKKDDNNPFSESYQIREHIEKIQQQEKQRRDIQQHLEQQKHGGVPRFPGDVSPRMPGQFLPRSGSDAIFPPPYGQHPGQRMSLQSPQGSSSQASSVPASPGSQTPTPSEPGTVDSKEGLLLHPELAKFREEVANKQAEIAAQNDGEDSEKGTQNVLLKQLLATATPKPPGQDGSPGSLIPQGGLQTPPPGFPQQTPPPSFLQQTPPPSFPQQTPPPSFPQHTPPPSMPQQTPPPHGFPPSLGPTTPSMVERLAMQHEHSPRHEGDDSVELTPEQQRQLAVIESMPYTLEFEIPPEEWMQKTPEEKERIMALKQQEVEARRREFEEINKKKPVQRRKKKSLDAGPGAMPIHRDGGQPKKRQRKSSSGPTGMPGIGMPPGMSQGMPQGMPQGMSQGMSQGMPPMSMSVNIPPGGVPGFPNMIPTPREELGEHNLDTLMGILHSLPPLPLEEPRISTSHSVGSVFGADPTIITSATTENLLHGIYGYSLPEDSGDYYNTTPFPRHQPPAMSPRTTGTSSAPGTPGGSGTPKHLSKARRRFLGDSTLPYSDGQQGEGRFGDEDGDNAACRKLMGGKPGMQTLLLPSPPLIEPRMEVMSRMSAESPNTVVSASSPETELGDRLQDKSEPLLGLRLISMDTENSDTEDADEPARNTESPAVPLICPRPIKGSPTRMKDDPDREFSLQDRMLKDKERESGGFASKMSTMPGMNRPLQDANQPVAVTLTLNGQAAENIGGVISAIADLLKIAVPPPYEISRSPSPEQGYVRLRQEEKHQEESINIESLILSKPSFCQHCTAVIMPDTNMVRRKPSELGLMAPPPPIYPEMPDLSMHPGDEFMVTFCSKDCCTAYEDTQQSLGSGNRREARGSYVDDDSCSTAADNHGSETSMSEPPATPTTPGTSPDKRPTPGHTPLPDLSTRAGQISLLRRKSSSNDIKREMSPPPGKKWRGRRWQRWNQHVIKPELPLPAEASQSEMMMMMSRLDMLIKLPKPAASDTRKCQLCLECGDTLTDGPGRLLNMDVDKWLHLNCALWCTEVYETLNGALMNIEAALKRGLNQECVVCSQRGATISCFRPKCGNVYHLACAMQANVVFYQDKTILCPQHKPSIKEGPIENQLLSLEVYRKVYIWRDEVRQVANVIQGDDTKYAVRVGSLIFHSIGQLLPQQIVGGKFNTRDYIYPIGFKTSRYYWSGRTVSRRCRYICRILEEEGAPIFTVKVIEDGFDDVIHRNTSCSSLWMKILEPIDKLRKDADLVKMFPSYLSGEDMFGLTEPSLLRIIESMSGMEQLPNYAFRFGRCQLIEMPLAINPTGCARSEPKLRTHFKRPPRSNVHPGSGRGSTVAPGMNLSMSPSDIQSPYMKHFVSSKAQQYRKLKTEWKTNVYLRRSNIQGLGLFAAKDLEKHTMVIEYIGEVIRSEVAERREQLYDSQNRGVYQFRVDDELVVDATMEGGPARYINHCCQPNCLAEIVPFEKDDTSKKIIIIAKKKIATGEELTYDYKFDFEDDQHKIPCNCGAPNCRKWMN